MKSLARLIFAPVLFASLFLLAPKTLAYVNTGWDWHLVNGQPKRTLHYCAGIASRVVTSGRSVDVQSFTPGFPTDWGTWLTEAAENLNNANTGWRLEPSPATFPPCQILITLADISESIHGGGVSTPVDTNGDGAADLTRITIDSNLEETPGGWGREGEDTLDPVGTLMHELTHAMRLDHHPDSKHSDAADADISDPRKPGDHSANLSEEDLQELRDAAGSYEEQGREFLGSEEHSWNFKGVKFVAPEGAFVSRFNYVDVNVYEGVAIPDPLALPDDYSHVMGSGTIYWRTTAKPQKPVRISIPYSEEELKGGDGAYFGDLHNFVPPEVHEDTLAVFRYIQRPFGVESETPNHWEKVEGATVDTQNNVVTFETDVTGIYGIAGMAVEKGSLSGGAKTSKIVLVIIVIGAVAYFLLKKRQAK